MPELSEPYCDAQVGGLKCGQPVERWSHQCEWHDPEGTTRRQKTQPWSLVRALVVVQANDEGLWFVAETAPEAYLQQELRRLHAAIEEEEKDA